MAIKKKDMTYTEKIAFGKRLRNQPVFPNKLYRNGDIVSISPRRTGTVICYQEDRYVSVLCNGYGVRKPELVLWFMCL